MAHPGGADRQVGHLTEGSGRAARLTLVCHGDTEATRRAAFPTSDEPLTPHALKRSAHLRDRLQRPERCWTSPARCAGETASALGCHGVDDPLLRDCDYGRWAGRTLAEVGRTERDAVAAWLADPEACPHGGEALQGVVTRVDTWLAARSRDPGHTVAITHPLVIRCAAILAIGAPVAAVWRLDVAPLSLTRLKAQAGRWRLASFNEQA